MKDFFVPKDLLLFSDSMGINSDFSVRGFSAGVSEAMATLTVAAHISGISLIGSNNLSTMVFGSPVTVAIPSVAQAGDIVLLCVALGTTSNVDIIVTTNGYTELVDIYADDSADSNLGVFFKIMSDNIDENVTFSGPTTAHRGLVSWVGVFRGVSATSPIDTSVATATGINSGIANSPAVTPVTDRALVLTIGACGLWAPAYYVPPVQNVQAPAGFEYIYFDQINGASYNTIALAIASKEWIAGEGAVDPPAWDTINTQNASYSSWAASTVVLRPK